MARNRVSKTLNIAVLVVSVIGIAQLYTSKSSEDPEHCDYLLPWWALTTLAKYCLVTSVVGLRSLVVSPEHNFTKKLYSRLMKGLTIAICVQCGLITISMNLLFQKEGHTDSTLTWLEKEFVVSDEQWRDITACFVERGICNDIPLPPSPILPPTPFSGELQRGCCRPPKHCVYHYINQTYMPLSDDPECLLWDKNSGVGCFECGWCKKGYLSTFYACWFIFVGLCILARICFWIAKLCREERRPVYEQRIFEDIEPQGEDGVNYYEEDTKGN